MMTDVLTRLTIDAPSRRYRALGGRPHLICIVLFATLLAMWSLPPCAAAQPRPVDWFALADRASTSGDTMLAFELFETAHDNGDNSIMLLKRLIEISHDASYKAREENQRALAEQMLVRALEVATTMKRLYPERPESHFYIAFSSGKLAQFKGNKAKVQLGRAVAEHSRRAIEIDSTFAPAHAILGVFYREVATLNWVERLAARALFGGLPSGDLEDSRRHLENAAALEPTIPCVLWELAQTYSALRRPADVAATLRRAVQLPPLTSEDRRTQDYARRWLHELDPDPTVVSDATGRDDLLVR